jgi:hypothetical protein
MLRLFQNMPWLIDWLIFAAGIIIGFYFGRPPKKITTNNEHLSEVVGSVQSELGRIDAAVARLWTTCFASTPRSVSGRVNKTYSSDAAELLTTDLSNIRYTLGALAENISDVVHRVEVLVKEGGPQVNLKRSSARTEAALKGDVLIERSNEPSIEDSDATSSYSERVIPRTAEAIIEFYNRAVNDPVARERFREDYSPIRIGTVNAVERRQNPTIRPEIRETTDGDFFALPIAGRIEFAVFPRLGLTIEAVSYSAGAMGEVFEKTRGHDPKLFYSRYRVKQPAVFRIEGDRWQLRESGELDLGLGE